jgi:hypothetical protein
LFKVGKYAQRSAGFLLLVLDDFQARDLERTILTDREMNGLVQLKVPHFSRMLRQTKLAINPMNRRANPAARKSSTIRKLFPAQDGSTWAKIQQPTATIVSPAVKTRKQTKPGR